MTTVLLSSLTTPRCPLLPRFTVAQNFNGKYTICKICSFVALECSIINANVSVYSCIIWWILVTNPHKKSELDFWLLMRQNVYPVRKPPRVENVICLVSGGVPESTLYIHKMVGIPVLHSIQGWMGIWALPCIIFHENHNNYFYLLLHNFWNSPT